MMSSGVASGGYQQPETPDTNSKLPENQFLALGDNFKMTKTLL
jgi:hypothetical protein